ncbi:leucine-rich repeat domain-containing protein [Paracrocinitomix mangrovi]|uniref:leucine-rich repeat domain-containing protein n=1 Tax=Paracrocinitomix mangrovi TaxID=2862509 RepID=UPI001C8D8D05|nr:leucine-rich repeat domain-containing protein [Paracrocinitomix mangrovi]UKN03337.1 leucine-rich repeat domain-containing protein [Paracrocinitomix mangrovi]
MKKVAFTLFVVCLVSTSKAIKVTSIEQIKGNSVSVTEIDLSNKGIVEFPNEILACKNLQVLNLSNNGFVTIPWQVGKLANLKVLDLSENQNISPRSLDALLDSAKFQLREVNLENCALFYLPEGVARHEKLERINASNNYISVLPYKMMHLTKLEEANFSNNKLRSISWLVSKWWSLKYLDVSGNKDLETEGLMLNISYLDKIDKLIISDLSMIPDAFQYYMGTEVVIKNSMISEFPTSGKSSRLKRITFDNCVFNKPLEVVEELNSTSLEKIAFRRTDPLFLRSFLNIDVDSIDIRGNELSSIDQITELENVKWVDVRGNNVSQKSIDHVLSIKPDLNLVYSEPIQESKGIKPPIPGLEPKPQIATIKAGVPQNLKMGKTIFDIPENAFVTSNGEVYDGEVKMSYTEYFDPVDIFLSGITMTTSFDDEPFMLSSGGMFKLEAETNDGEKLEVNPNQPINATLISQNGNQDMQVWQMDQEGSWQATASTDNVKKVFQLDQSKLDSIMLIDYGDLQNVQVEYIADRFVPYVKKGERFKDFEIGFTQLYTFWDDKSKIIDNGDKLMVYNRTFHNEYMSNMRFVYDGDSADHYHDFIENLGAYCNGQYSKLKSKKSKSRMYTKEGPHYITELKLSPDYENDNMDLTFKFKDSLVNIPVLFKTRTNSQSAIHKEIVSKFNRYQLSYKRYVREKRKNFFKIKPKLERLKKGMKERALAAEVARQKRVFEIRQSDPRIVDLGSVKRSIEIRGFGLWNCDARTRMVAPTEMASEFSSVAGGMINDEVEKIVLVDKSQNGVLTFDPDQENKPYFDKNSKNIIVVFFASAGIGVFKSWVQKIREGRMEVQMLDPQTEDDNLREIFTSEE